jgi:uncharacterized protein YjiS (DUF1127 family)
MEAEMLARNELDIKIKDYQSLTAEGQALLRDQALADARAERAKAMRAIFGAVAAWASGRRAAYRRWRELRAAAAQLHTFDDRQLKDIGLRRSEITGAVYGYNRDESLRSRAHEAPQPEVTAHRPCGNDNLIPSRRGSVAAEHRIKTAA